MNPYQIVPFPFGWQPPASLAPAHSAAPPARVRFALELLQHLTHKTTSRAAANDISIEILPGQVLTREESLAQTNACRLLSDYFTGNLGPSEWEQRTEESDPPTRRPGMIVRCFVCAPNPPQATCVLCKGSGELLVFPVAEPRGESS